MENHGDHGPGGHDKHAGHDPEAFRRTFWLSLALTVPIVATSPMVMDWFGYTLDFPGIEWIGPVLGTAVFGYGGWPFLVGGVFNKVNPSVYQRRENPVPPKDNYYRKDMADWARYLDIKMVRPSVFPVNSVKALRGAFVAIDAGTISAYSKAVFTAYWRDDKDISQDAVLRDIVNGAGMDDDDFLAKIGDDKIKRKLFETTDELIARGGFGGL